MNRYKRVRRLGRGAFGEAILMKDIATDALRVIKVLTTL